MRAVPHLRRERLMHLYAPQVTSSFKCKCYAEYKISGSCSMTTSALALRGLGFRTRYDVTNLNRGARHVLAIPCTAYLGAAPRTPCNRRPAPGERLIGASHPRYVGYNH